MNRKLFTAFSFYCSPYSKRDTGAGCRLTCKSQGETRSSRKNAIAKMHRSDITHSFSLFAANNGYCPHSAITIVRAKVRETYHSKGNQSLKAKVASKRALATYLNGTVSNTAESPAGSRPLCEDRPNAVRQLCFFKIAVRSAIRSTLLTAERLAATSEGRTSHITFGNSRAGGVSNRCARVPSSLVLSVAQKVQDITTIRKNRTQIKG